MFLQNFRPWREKAKSLRASKGKRALEQAEQGLSFFETYAAFYPLSVLSPAGHWHPKIHSNRCKDSISTLRAKERSG